MWRMRNAVRQAALAGLALALAAPALAAPVDESEPNDDAASATPVSPAGTPLSAQFPPAGAGALVRGALEAGDVDVFGFDLAEGDLLAAAVFAAERDGALDPILQLVGPGGALPASDDEGPGFSAAAQVRVPAGQGGRWHAVVSGFGDLELDGDASGESHAEAGDYRLVLGVVEEPPAFEEPGGDNDSAAAADPLPEPGGAFLADAPGGVAAVAGRLEADDVDYYAVPIDAAGRLVVAIVEDGAGEFHDPVLRILDGDGNVVGGDDDAGDGFLAAASATAGGASAQPWRVAVGGFGDEDFDGGHGEVFDYTLVVAFDEGAGVGPERCDPDDDGDVDVNDLGAILLALDDAVPAGDPRDADADGVITVFDLRLCVLECDEVECRDPDAPPPPPPGGGCGLLGVEVLLPLALVWRRRRRAAGA